MSAYEEVAESRIIWSRDYVGADVTALIWSVVRVEIDLGRLTRLIYPQADPVVRIAETRLI